MFVRKIKFNIRKSTTNTNFSNDDEEKFLSTSGTFVRFLNEFEGQKSLFRKEGIEFDSNQKNSDSFGCFIIIHLFIYLYILPIYPFFILQKYLKKKIFRKGRYLVTLSVD